MYINGEQTIKRLKWLNNLPHISLIILFIIIGFILLFLNSIIHNGNVGITYIYKFLFYSTLFTFLYGILLQTKMIHLDLVYVGILIMGILFIFHFKKTSKMTHLQGSFYLQNEIVKYNTNEDNYYPVENLNNTNYTILSDVFIKDDKHIYYGSGIVLDLDINSSEVLFYNQEATEYIKDSENVYCGSKKLENTDPETFKAIEPYYSTYRAQDKNSIYNDCDKEKLK